MRERAGAFASHPVYAHLALNPLSALSEFSLAARIAICAKNRREEKRQNNFSRRFSKIGKFALRTTSLLYIYHSLDVVYFSIHSLNSSTLSSLSRLIRPRHNKLNKNKFMPHLSVQILLLNKM